MPGTRSKAGRDQADLDRLMPLKQAARYVSGLSPITLRALIRARVVAGEKVGRDWFTTPRAVMDYKARNPRPGRKAKTGRPIPH